MEQAADTALSGANGDWKKEGYKVKHSPHADQSLLRIEAFDKKGKRVGKAEFLNEPDKKYIKPLHEGKIMDAMPAVRIDPEHQRKGLATEMYRLAEEISGKKIRNMGKRFRTQDGNSLWEQPDRSFGETITAGILDFPRKRLPEAIWLYEEDSPLPRLQPKLRARILSEARYRLKKFGAELIGATLYGGAANYQYHEGADIDVALYIDWDDFDGSEDIMQEAFKTVEIPWEGFRLHLFVKPSNQREQFEISDATYDVLHDEWKLKPLILPRDFDPDIFFKPMLEMAEKRAEQFDLSMGRIAREWARLKNAIGSVEEGRDEDAVLNRIELSRKILLDEVEELSRMFVAVWTGRRRLHDELRERVNRGENIGRFARFQYDEVLWKYLDQSGYAEFLKNLAKAQEAGVIERLVDEAVGL